MTWKIVKSKFQIRLYIQLHRVHHVKPHVRIVQGCAAGKLFVAKTRIVRPAVKMGPNVQRSSFGASRLPLGKVLILAALVPLLGTLYVYFNVAFPSFLNFNRVGLLKDTCWAETVVHPVLLWRKVPLIVY